MRAERIRSMSEAEKGTNRIPYEIIVFIIISGLSSLVTLGLLPGMFLIEFWNDYLDLHLGESGWGSCIIFAVIWPIIIAATYILVLSPFKKMTKLLKKFSIFLLVGIIETLFLSYISAIFISH
jgi:hypothetical protein